MGCDDSGLGTNPRESSQVSRERNKIATKIGTVRWTLAWALVVGALMGIFGLFAFDGPPSVSAQTDTTAPTVSSIAITSDPNDDTRIDGWAFDSGVYGIADSIQLTVTFNEDVIVTGGPQLELDIGGSAKTAAYESADGSNVVFSYTMAEGDSDTDGIAIAANKLILSGGCIEDAANNDVDLSNSAVTAQAGHKVDGDRVFEASA